MNKNGWIVIGILLLRGTLSAQDIEPVFPARTYDFELSDIAKRLAPVISFNRNMRPDNYIWKDGRSSALIEKGKPDDFYEITKINDDDYDTAWVEGKKDDSIGEWVIIKVNDYNKDYDFFEHYRKHDIDNFTVRLKICNGYQKSKDLYYKNNRVKNAKITVYAVPITIGINDAGFEWNPDIVLEKDIVLSDEIQENPIHLNYEAIFLNFTLPEEYEEPNEIEFYIKLEIKSVYKGTKYQDTCISELNAELEKDPDQPYDDSN